MVPSDWECVPLKKIIADLRAGVSVLSEDRPAENGDRGVLKVSCISGGAFIPSENKRLLPGEEQRVNYCVEQGDVLISRANTYELVAASCYVANSYPNLFLSDKHWKVVLRNSRRDSARWLAYTLNLPALRRAFLAHATGTSGSMKNISKPSFLGIEIPRPPAEEQVAIAGLLGLQDTLQTLVARLVLRKRKLKAAIMQQCLGGNHSSGPFSHLKRKDVLLGEVFSERNETNRTDLPLLSITADRGIIPRSKVDRKDSSSDDKRNYKRIAAGDIGYNTMRMWQGVSGLSDLEGIVSPAYTVCIPTIRIDAHFAAHLFKFPPVINLFRRYSQGLVDDTLSLKFPTFSQIRISLPHVEEQKWISSVLSSVDNELGLLRRYNDALQKQKQGLMEKLLTGQIRLKGARHD